MNDILKQIDDLIIETEINIEDWDDEEYFDGLDKFYNSIKNIMKNYEKVLEINHFKQAEI